MFIKGDTKNNLIMWTGTGYKEAKTSTTDSKAMTDTYKKTSSKYK